MLVKTERATTAASSSPTHRPKHFWGTLLASQHCSGINKLLFRVRATLFLKCLIIFQSQFYTYICIPGHILLMHASVWDATPSHGAPPKSSSCSLNLWFSLTPSPQLTEHFPIVQLLQRQSTENKFWFILPLRKISSMRRYRFTFWYLRFMYKAYLSMSCIVLDIFFGYMERYNPNPYQFRYTTFQYHHISSQVLNL